MRWRMVAVASSCAAVLAMGCSDDETSTPVAPPQAKPQIASLSEAVCDLAFRCCDRGEANYFLGPFVHADNCADRLLRISELETEVQFDLKSLLGPTIKLPNLGALERATAEGRAWVDGAALSSCIQYLQELACNAPEAEEDEEDGCTPPEPEPEPGPCDADKLFVGLVGEGGVCTSGSNTIECARGLVCRSYSSLGVTGQCARLGTIGDACAMDGECDEGLHCALADGTCHALRKAGEACAFSDRDDPSPDPSTLLIRCEPDLRCDPITDTCVERCARGAACSSDDDCDDERELTCIMGRCDLLRPLGLACGADDDCVETLRCESDPASPSNRICQLRLPLDAVCSSHGDCNSGFCNPATYQCAAQVAAGALCPTGQDEQCANGRCEAEDVSCASDAACPLTNACDLDLGRCGNYCVAPKPDGATCDGARECQSEACVAGYCRTLPLATGAACESNAQCDSEFCGLEDERVCTQLPLKLGARCSNSAQCDSEVCFAAVGSESKCVMGLDEGEACGQAGDPPCNPKKYYCDGSDLGEPTCMTLHETGEPCERSEQCRGDCITQFGRAMCSPSTPKIAAICDGSPQQ